MNEVVKVLSSKQLEDFTIRWDEIFKDRIDGLEKYFHSKQIDKTIRTNNSRKDKQLPRHDWKKVLNRRSRKMHLLEQIRTICLLTNNNLAFDARIEEETADENSTFINVELKLSARNADEESPQFTKVNFKCEVSPCFLFREFTREEAIKLLMENIRKLFKQKSLKRKAKSSLAKKMLDESKTVSCYDQFFDLQIDEKGKKHKSNVVSMTVV